MAKRTNREKLLEQTITTSIRETIQNRIAISQYILRQQKKGKRITKLEKKNGIQA